MTPTPPTDTETTTRTDTAAGLPITVHRSQGPLRVSFPPPEQSPLRKVRKLAAKARAWEPAIAAGIAAYNEGNWLAAIEAVTPEPQDGVWCTPPDEGDAWDAISTAESYAAGWTQQAHEAEWRFLRDSLPPKARPRTREDEETGRTEYELPKSVDVFALVAALTHPGLAEVRVLHDFTGIKGTGRCNGACREARQATCVCACGGANHGVGVSARWRLVKSTEIPDSDNADATHISREYLAS